MQHDARRGAESLSVLTLYVVVYELEQETCPVGDRDDQLPEQELLAREFLSHDGTKGGKREEGGRRGDEGGEQKGRERERDEEDRNARRGR
jgi:hypothetical protein